MKSHLRVSKSFGDLSLGMRLYGSRSQESLAGQIKMCPHPYDCHSCCTIELQKPLLRQHNFKLKTTFRVCSCVHCKKRIRFGTESLRCRACPLRCHLGCHQLLNVNCIPQPVLSNIKNCYLRDFAPTVAPYVPALIVHCVTEIEARGLQEEGLYRVCSTKGKCSRLKHKLLRGKVTPHLGNKDVHTLCCCIKDFLRSLRQPLIPIYYRRRFVLATKQQNGALLEEKVYKAVMLLEPSHRDTLAFLMLHWQRVGQSPAVRMNFDNLAAVFVPTLFDDSDMDLNSAINLQQVLRALLMLPDSFWWQFVEVEPVQMYENDTDYEDDSTTYGFDHSDDSERASSAHVRWRSMKTIFKSMINLSA